ncbi:glycosyl hydrolase family 28 protein [Sphingomonas cannabina]|uniref:glycosyl hydrolase family 28 protein n=1 Tax=Sphingomonas cannabina TaxID=2899123 RepID=UPI001F3F4F2A|nr:glycosyl hydrolase family 28 protein [Sphingomonas cannabina]UIJ47193.1 glycosyl hydrolase family 28 protein [Sphingomonas cannabina]
MTRLRLAPALLLALAALPASAQSQTLRIHAPPAGKAFWTHLNDDFTVRVRVPGGEWQDLYEYDVKVDLDRPQDASMVAFDMAGPVEVSVKKNNGDVRRVEVRPTSAGVKARLVGNTAYFRLDRPAKLSIEFDGDRLHNLHLFADAPEPELPPPGPGVVYFGPGVHPLPEGQKSFRIPSNTTVVVAGGALVQGNIEIRDAENVRVIGHGIIDRPEQGITIANSRNVTIDGPIFIDPNHYTVACGQSSNVTVRDVKSFSASSWSDGLDFMSCSDVRIDGVFMRNSDDTIAVYGSRWDYRGDARNYLVTNSILWADIAHPINIGLHGNAEAPEVLENLVFRNIDVLGHDEDDRNYQGVMAISNSDNNLVRNVRFEDIRIDSIEEGMLFNLRVLFNPKYSHAPGRGIEDVTIRNVGFKGGDINRPVIAGYSADRIVRGVTIENVTVGGAPLRRSDIDVGQFVEGLTVK